MNFKERTDARMAYAGVLRLLCRAGFWFLVIAMGLYLTGALPARVPPERAVAAWGLPLADYLRREGVETGWAWVKDIGKADGLAIAAICFLSGATVVCYLRMVPIYARRRDWIYLALVIAELAILLLVASGVLKAVG